MRQSIGVGIDSYCWNLGLQIAILTSGLKPDLTHVLGFILLYRLEAVASRLEAIAILGWRPSLY